MVVILSEFSHFISEAAICAVSFHLTSGEVVGLTLIPVATISLKFDIFFSSRYSRISPDQGYDIQNWRRRQPCHRLSAKRFTSTL
jgi:hypothetical protein